MECSRCKSRHSAHRDKYDPYAAHPFPRGRERVRVIREGVAKWTFPARTPTQPHPRIQTQHPHRPWNRTPSWSMQVQQQTVPEVRGVVPDDLARRIERVLCFPMGTGGCGEGEGESLHHTSSHSITTRQNRGPTGALLQEYLDQLEPGGGLADDEDEEEELIFPGSESEGSEGDIVLEPEGETYTTPYLLFLQHSRSRRTHHNITPPSHTHTIIPTTKEQTGEWTTEEGREGAVGRSGHHRSNTHTPKTPTDSKEPPTPPTDTNNRDMTTTNTTTSRERETPISNNHLNSDINGHEVIGTSGAEEPSTKGATEMRTKYKTSKSKSKQDSREVLLSGGQFSRDIVEMNDGNDLENGYIDGHDNQTESNDEEEEEEETGELNLKSGKEKTKKKKGKKKKKKRTSGKRSKSNAKETEDEKEEEETLESKLEVLKKSIALSLFRDYAKNVYTKEHPEFRLFESFEPDQNEDSRPDRNPLNL